MPNATKAVEPPPHWGQAWEEVEPLLVRVLGPGGTAKPSVRLGRRKLDGLRLRKGWEATKGPDGKMVEKPIGPESTDRKVDIEPIILRRKLRQSLRDWLDRSTLYESALARGRSPAEAFAVVVGEWLRGFGGETRRMIADIAIAALEPERIPPRFAEYLKIPPAEGQRILPGFAEAVSPPPPEEKPAPTPRLSSASFTLESSGGFKAEGNLRRPADESPILDEIGVAMMAKWDWEVRRPDGRIAGFGSSPRMAEAIRDCADTMNTYELIGGKAT